jgi:hypothetical protein
LINLEGDRIHGIYLLKKSCDRVEKSTIAQMILKIGSYLVSVADSG